VITHGLIIDQEGALAQIKEQRKEMLTQLLPPALRVIANAVQQPPTTPVERIFQVKVAQDLLDREGTYARISRSEIRTETTFDWHSTEYSAREAISIVRGAIPGPTAPSPSGQGEAQQLIELTKRFAAGSVTGKSDYSERAAKVLAMATPLGSESEDQ